MLVKLDKVLEILMEDFNEKCFDRAGHADDSLFRTQKLKSATLICKRRFNQLLQEKKPKQSLEGEFNKKEKELEKKEADLKKMGEDLEKKKSVLSEEALGKKQAEFQEEMLKYRDVVGKSQVEIQKKERELTAPILEKLKKVIGKLAKRQRLLFGDRKFANGFVCDTGIRLNGFSDSGLRKRKVVPRKIKRASQRPFFS